MCGIAGLYAQHTPSWDVVKRFADVWIYQERRGMDACGVFALSEDGRLYYSKYPIPCHIFVPKTLEIWQRRNFVPRVAIAHARAATHGSPLVNKNNHPIVHEFAGGLVAMVHNGIVHMRHCQTKLTETDSEEILCLAKRALSSGALSDIIEGIVGSAAFFIMQVDRDMSLKRFIYGRNYNPLVYVSDGDVTIFGSEINDGGAIPVAPGIYDMVTGYSYRLKFATYPTYYLYDGRVRVRRARRGRKGVEDGEGEDKEDKSWLFYDDDYWRYI